MSIGTTSNMEWLVGPFAGVTDVLQNGTSVVDAGVARVTVPTKTSDLQNDSGFVTSSAIPTKTSDLQNDSGFITSSSLPTVDQTYNAASTNAQSGVAVAQAIASITPGGPATLNRYGFSPTRDQYITETNVTPWGTQTTYSTGFMFKVETEDCIALFVSQFGARGTIRVNFNQLSSDRWDANRVHVYVGGGSIADSYYWGFHSRPEAGHDKASSTFLSGFTVVEVPIIEIPYMLPSPFGPVDTGRWVHVFIEDAQGDCFLPEYLPSVEFYRFV